MNFPLDNNGIGMKGIQDELQIDSVTAQRRILVRGRGVERGKNGLRDQTIRGNLEESSCSGMGTDGWPRVSRGTLKNGLSL